MSRELSFELAGGPYAVTAARLALSELDELVDETQAFDVRLLVSELVTNSVKHASVGPEDSIKLSLAIDEVLIRCDVVDNGPGFDPPDDPAEDARDRGWGLFFVEQIADRWGVERESAPARPGHGGRGVFDCPCGGARGGSPCAWASRRAAPEGAERGREGVRARARRAGGPRACGGLAERADRTRRLPHRWVGAPAR